MSGLQLTPTQIYRLAMNSVYSATKDLEVVSANLLSPDSFLDTHSLPGSALENLTQAIDAEGWLLQKQVQLASTETTPALTSQLSNRCLTAQPEFRWHMDEPSGNSLDPNIGGDRYASQINSYLFEGLFKMEGAHVVRALAEDYEVSDDGKTWTIYLRHDGKWSDGVSVTAHDFEFSWKRTVAPKTASQSSDVLYVIKNAREINNGSQELAALGVTAVDDFTLVIQLNKPAAGFLYELAGTPFFPVPKHVVEREGEKWIQKHVSNGPYVVKKYEYGQYISMEKNPYYHEKDKILIDRMTVDFIVDSDITRRLYDDSDAVNRPNISAELTPDQVIALQNRGDLHVIHSPTLGLIAFNLKKYPFNTDGGASLRRAISLAIDRNRITKHNIKMGTSAYSVIHPDSEMTAQYKRMEGNFYDPEESERLLSESGFPRGNGLQPLNFVITATSSNRTMAEVIQRQLKEVGIPLEITAVEWNSAKALVDSGDFHLFYFGITNSPPTIDKDLGNYVTNRPTNNGHFENRRYDELYGKATSVGDTSTRFGYYREMEKILLDEVPITPIVYGSKAFLINPSVAGIRWFFGLHDASHACFVK